jgi:two-component system KDP operon response regulator KdpE
MLDRGGNMTTPVNDRARESGTVLIVEDDATLTHALARNLTARGNTALSAESVAAALAALQAHTPDLVLLDIDLPDGSGWEVVRVLREDGHSEVPVIVLSALRPNARLVAETGCVGMLEKPFPMDSLLRLIGTYCRKHAAGAALEDDGE